ncbi:MAG: hypothetical protein QOJ39_1277, partial [Candidatus Eremiobacteraeota bacterium]|nr:hypothetical protein [Candidatus Eremiobacteraeota bacterium]
MHRTSFLTALGAAAALTPLVVPPGRAGAATAAAVDEVRAKLLPGQRLVAFAVTEGANVIDLAG